MSDHIQTYLDVNERYFQAHADFTGKYPVGTVIPYLSKQAMIVQHDGKTSVLHVDNHNYIQRLELPWIDLQAILKART